MSTYHGDFQWKVLDFVVKRLQNDPYVSSLVGQRVYPQHMVTVNDPPIMPAITIARIGLGGDASIDELDYTFLQIDVWSKRDPVECWQIYANQDPINHVPQGVRALLHNQGFQIPEANIDLLSEIYVNDSLFEKDTRTFHLAARYRIDSAARAV